MGAAFAAFIAMVAATTMLQAQTSIKLVCKVVRMIISGLLLEPRFSHNHAARA